MNHHEYGPTEQEAKEIKSPPSINLKNHKHLSPVGDYYFAIANDGDFATVILAKDKDGNDYYLDLTRHEISQLFKGFSQAQVKFEFNGGRNA